MLSIEELVVRLAAQYGWIGILGYVVWNQWRIGIKQRQSLEEQRAREAKLDQDNKQFALEMEKQEAKMRVEALERERLLSDKLLLITQERSDMLARLLDMEKSVARLNKEIETLAEDLKNVQLERDKAISELSKAQLERDEALKENAKMKTRVEELENRVRKLESELEEFKQKEEKIYEHGL